MVTSLALDRHIHVTVNRRFDDRVRVSYSSMEMVDDFEDLEHELVREAMRMTGVTSGVEITTIADIPSRGTGLGSSSAVTVGLLNALYRFAGHDASPEQLAEEACRIEIDILGQPIGRQDQYAAAFGGVNTISFGPEGVEVNPVKISPNAFRAEANCIDTTEGGRVLVLSANWLSENIYLNAAGLLSQLLGRSIVSCEPIQSIEQSHSDCRGRT
jgi:D-glycero-alpha-D-manno-heptose-7-phosphate kinase